jgi:hypothetical protein
MNGPPIERRRPLVIELLGAPGAGKSSLLPAVHAACEAAGLTSGTVMQFARPLALRTGPGRLLTALPDGRTRSRAAWVLFRWAAAIASIAHAGRTWPLAAVAVRSQRGRPVGAESRDRRVLYWFHRLLGAHGLFLRRGSVDEVLVLDEGYVHRVVQLFASEVEDPDPVALERYLRAVPVPDLLVTVHAPVDRCLERITSRGVWARFEGRGPDALRRFVTHAHRAVELAMRHARDEGWAVVEVDNSGDLDSSRALVRTSVVERLQAGVGAGR